MLKTVRNRLPVLSLVAWLGACVDTPTTDSGAEGGASSADKDDEDDQGDETTADPAENESGDDGAEDEVGDDGSELPTGARPYTEPQRDPTQFPARVWRLTHLQYRKSVEDLVGVAVETGEFAAEIDNGVFKNLSDVAFVSDALARNYFEAAKTVAAQVSEDRLRAYAPSGTLAPTDAAGFALALASRAFRRPATEEEVAGYVEIFALAAQLDPEDRSAPFRAVLRGVLSSPHFLYRAEIGTPELSAHEVASLLSYSLLDGPPPESLRDAAERGELDSPDGVRRAVEDLLAQPAAEQTHREFLRQWLELSYFDAVEKFEENFPGFAAIRADMVRETEAFLEAHGNLASGSLAALLGTEVTTQTPALDAFYRAEAPTDDTTPRIGVLSLGMVLAQHGKPNLSSPTLRGLFVRDRLFCQHIELPPGFNPPPLSEAEARGEAKTTRELYELHASDPTCRTCHLLIDSIGFNLEEYDGAGRYRTTENGILLDTSADLVGTDVDGPISGTAELADVLSQSQWVAECMAIQAFRFYLGAMESSRGIDAIVEARRAAGTSVELGPLVAALLGSPSLRQRVQE